MKGTSTMTKSKISRKNTNWLSSDSDRANYGNENSAPNIQTHQTIR